MCCNRELFSNFKIHHENSSSIQAELIGIVRLQYTDCEVTLVEEVYVPGLQCNLLWVSNAISHNSRVTLNQNGAEMEK